MKRLTVIVIMLLVAVTIGDATTIDALSFKNVGIHKMLTPLVVAKQQTHSIMAFWGSTNARLNTVKLFGIARHTNQIASIIASDSSVSASRGNSASATSSYSGDISSGGASALSGNTSNSGGAGSGFAGGFAGLFNTATSHFGGTPANHTNTPGHHSGGGIPFDPGKDHGILSAPEISAQPAGLALGLLSGILLFILERKKN